MHRGEWECIEMWLSRAIALAHSHNARSRRVVFVFCCCHGVDVSDVRPGLMQSARRAIVDAAKHARYSRAIVVAFATS